MTASAFCQQLMPCLAENLNLAVVCRIQSAGVAELDLTGAYITVGDATTMYKATEMQMCASEVYDASCS